MGAEVRIRALRGVHLAQGQVLQAGEIRKVSPAVAASALASGRAELVHVDDLSAVRAAEQAELQATLRELGPVRLGPPPGSPWQPWRG
jgi:hypothetical protein